MSRFPRKYVASLAMFAALAASATHLTAQTLKHTKTLEDVEIEPLSEVSAARAQVLEYERSIRIQPGSVERDIAKTISPKDQPLEATAPTSATTRLEQGTGARQAAPIESPSPAPSRAAEVEWPAPPLAEAADPELSAAPTASVARPAVIPAPAAREPVTPAELATAPVPEAVPEPLEADAARAIAPRRATESGLHLMPISMSRSFGRVVKAKDPAAAPVAANLQESASVGIPPRGRSSRSTAATLSATQPELSLTLDGTETAAELLAGTEPAGTPLLAQRSAAQRYVERPWSYISLGGNFGLDEGKTELGDTAFAISSKIGLTNYLSIRPTALLGDRATFLVPLTYDLAIGSSDPFRPATFIPYLGGGFLLTTHDGNNFGPLVSGGLDVRVRESIVINAGINAGFLRDETELGIMLGVGYIFPTDF